MERDNSEDQLIDLLCQLDSSPEDQSEELTSKLDDSDLSKLNGAKQCLEYLGMVRNLCKRELVPMDQDSWKPEQHSYPVPSLSKHPTSIGRFEVVKILGSGGFGHVYLAHDPKLERFVALKVPKPQALISEESRSRFQLEARAAAILSHPNIVAVYESGELGPIQFIAYKYCPGMTLSSWLKSDSLLHQTQIAARITKQIAEAVQHAHQKGVIHRDLKPSNILLESDERDAIEADNLEQRLRISDFGLAKLMDDGASITNTEAIIGTPAYMSPEQAEGNQIVDELSDVYSIGAILYELTTGRPPHRKDSIVATLRAVTDDNPVAPSAINSMVSKDLNAICLKCLDKDPANRYQTAHELSLDLEAYLDQRPISISQPGWLQHFEKWCRRNQQLVLVLLAAMMFSLLVAVVSLLWINQARQTAESARINAENSRLETQYQAGYAQRLLGRQLGFTADFIAAKLENQKAIDILRPLTDDSNNFLYHQEYLKGLVDRVEILIQSGDIQLATQVAYQANDFLAKHPEINNTDSTAARLVYYTACCHEIREEFDSASKQFEKSAAMLNSINSKGEFATEVSNLQTQLDNRMLYLTEISGIRHSDERTLVDNVKNVSNFVKSSRAIFYYFEDESIAHHTLASYHLKNQNWQAALRNLQISIARLQRVENTTGTQLFFRHKRLGKLHHDLSICLLHLNNKKLAVEYFQRAILHTQYVLKHNAKDVTAQKRLVNHYRLLMESDTDNRQKYIEELNGIRSEIPEIETIIREFLNSHQG